MAELAVAAVGVGVAVASAVLSPLLGVVFDRISKSRKFIEFFKGEQVIKFDEEILNRLYIALYTISNVLEDAQVKEGAENVRTWLGKVRAEVQHADDLLDEFNTECLRLQLLGEGLLDQFLHKQTQPELKVHRFRFPFRKPKKNPGYADATLIFEELMPNLEKLATRLEEIEKQIQRLGLEKLDPKKKLPHREPSSSVVDKSQFFGRDDEKEKMIERVLSDGGAPDVSVVAITGMGGIGKTTLAQLVYNDDRVKEKFLTRAWVCVSEEYDAFKVRKALLRELNSAVVDNDASFNDLQVKLRDNLDGKCFLIILDDIWDENPWNSLKTPLSYGSRGSKIIVTTRNEKVALMMQTATFHQLKPMREDQSWSLFNKQALEHGDHAPLHEFETIGKKIVKKCNGLPLAIKAIAGALCPERDISVWQDFLSSEDWAVGGDILPALSLSYKHLPSHLKGCFAFCALFHKDVPFDKDEVVLLWMANDLVSTQKAGHGYFEELKSRSFFESVNGKEYLMHDLINDLARSVAGNTCIRLEDFQAAYRDQSLKRKNGLPPELQHFSYLRTQDEKFEWLNWVAQVRSLRTFLPIHQYHLYPAPNLTTNFFSDTLPKFVRLRALNLSRYHILVVPDSIGDLKHLRFLNLASTNIKKLPNAICKCLNLQTLILAKCERLVELPEDMRHLKNLQHVDLRGVGEPFIKKMATWLRIFKDIQNISVLVDKIQGSDLELLVQLQVSDSLNIDVTTMERGKRAGLIEKVYVEDLTLEWGGVAESPEDELNKFVKLQPHTNTKKLTIRGYTGKRFPDWLGDAAFSNIESLSLINCKNCFSLPSLGQLTGLKTLVIWGMDGISEIGEEFYGDASTSKPFQALEELEFNDMAEWTIWNVHSDIVFPSLQALKISNCTKMLSLPPLGQLIAMKKLEISGMDGITNIGKEFYGDASTSKPFQALEELEFNDMAEWTIWNVHSDIVFPSLQALKISNCTKMLSLPPLGQLIALKKLEISGMDGITKIGKEFYGDTSTSKPFQALEELEISDMAEWAIWNMHSVVFPSLQALKISNCKKMLSLPPLGQLTGLKTLVIWGMDGVSEIGKEFYGDASTSKPFQALEELEFNDMAEWTIWNTHSDLDFSSLKFFIIRNCPKLVNDLPCGDSSEPIPLFSFSKLEEMYIETLWVNGCKLFHQTLTSLQSLEIKKCNNILSFPEGGLAAPNLKRLVVYDCREMKSLPARMHTQLPMLTYLSIWDCPEIECFPEGGLPSSLETLSIGDCSKMRNCQTNWGLQTLQSLKVVYLMGFEDTLFPEEGLLPSSLQKLTINHFSNLESLNEKGLQHLSSLQTLNIHSCPNLKYLPLQKFSSSLSDMRIWSCPLVESFPEGLASSFSTLYITRCPKMAERIKREKGEDWPKVSHIPDIWIDYKRI